MCRWRWRKFVYVVLPLCGFSALYYREGLNADAADLSLQALASG